MNTVKSINVESGLYTCDEALGLIEQEINVLSLDKCAKVLKVVHGYGSSGSGGAIKKALPTLLNRLVKQNKILDYVHNNNFGVLSPKYKHYTKLYPSLILDSDLQNLNAGITIIFLK
jgi:hypothetical protein